jgi:mono/diheme cytochrome c family protein
VIRTHLSRLLASNLLLGAVAVATLVGCRGQTSEDPPIHLIGDMDWQAHRRPQSESPMFADKRASRPVDKRTVSRGHLKADDATYRGLDAKGAPVKRVPFEVTADTVARGQERFNVYCAPCHDQTGAGNGTVAQRSGGAFAAITPLYVDRLKDAPDGEIFQTITYGKGRMPGYAAQIPEEDRWAIVTWVRVLQQSQAGSIDDVPASERGQIQAQEGAK